MAFSTIEEAETEPREDIIVSDRTIKEEKIEENNSSPFLKCETVAKEGISFIIIFFFLFYLFFLFPSMDRERKTKEAASGEGGKKGNYNYFKERN